MKLKKELNNFQLIFTISFHGIANFREKILLRNTFAWLLLMFSHSHIKKNSLLVSIFYLHVFLISYKIQQRQTIIWTFWMKHTCKNVLVADLANVIVHHLKSICRTLILCDILSPKKGQFQLIKQCVVYVIYMTYHATNLITFASEVCSQNSWCIV